MGADPEADTALELLRSEGVELDGLQRVAEPTGLALSAVDAAGETTIGATPRRPAGGVRGPPPVTTVDGTAAGDACVGAAVAGLLTGLRYAELLARACAAGALTTTRPDAQPSLPTAAEIDEVLAR